MTVELGLPGARAHTAARRTGSSARTLACAARGRQEAQHQHQRPHVAGPAHAAAGGAFGASSSNARLSGSAPSVPCLCSSRGGGARVTVAPTRAGAARPADATLQPAAARPCRSRPRRLPAVSAFWLNADPASSGGPADHVLRPGDCQYKMARLILNIAWYRTAVPACTPARPAATGRQVGAWWAQASTIHGNNLLPPPTAVAPASHVRGRARSRKRLLPPSACLCPCLLDVCRASPSARGQNPGGRIQAAARTLRARSGANTSRTAPLLRPPRLLPHVELSISRPDSLVVFTQSP